MTKCYDEYGDQRPDRYCYTTPDGDCTSKDPRCMHQPVGVWAIPARAELIPNRARGHEPQVAESRECGRPKPRL